MNKTRLLKTASILANLRTEKKKLRSTFKDKDDCTFGINPAKLDFNLISWVTLNFNEGFCNTAACAVGTAMLHPDIQKMGLKPGFVDDEGYGRFSVDPTYKGLKSWKAVEAFYEIKDYEATYLFDSYSYESLGETTPKEVAERIRKFVKEGTIPDKPSPYHYW